MQNQQQPQYNDEIDLKDLILVLWQGKWIIIASVVLALVAALAYLNLVPQTYKGQIQVKSLTEMQIQQLQIDEASNVMAIDSQTIGQAMISAMQNDQVSISGGHPNWTINFSSQYPNQVVADIETALPSYQATAMQALSFNYKTAVENLTSSQESSVEALKKQIKLAKVAGIEVNTSSEITANTLPYLRGYKVLQAELDMLMEDVAEPIAINPFDQGDFQLINVILDNISLQPKIKPTLLLALSFVLGGMLGVFILIIRNVLRDK